MSILRVLISDYWPDNPEASWALINNGKLISSGRSAPAAWPKSDRTEAVLSGTQVGWAQVRLPQAKAREQMRALPFAMEEQLLREPDSQHFTLAHQEGEQCAVLVVGRDRLKRLVAQFVALGRPLDSAWSALACLPLEPGSWTLAIEPSHWLLRTAGLRALIDDAPEPGQGLPPIIATLFAQAQAQGNKPAAVEVLGDSGTVGLLIKGMQIETHVSADWPWHEIPEKAANLLHGEFQSAHARKRLLSTIRPVAMLIAGIAILHLVLGVGAALLRQQELKEVRARMTQLARTQLPGRALQDPALQLHGELQMQRQLHGQLADDDALALLSDLSGALGSESANSLQSLHYEDRQLVAIFARPLDLDALQSRLTTRGIVSTRRNENGLVLQRKPL